MQHHVTNSGEAPSGTCLIIEDSEFDSEKLTRIMHRNVTSMKVSVASTLQSARKALSGPETSLILLDNNLPDGLGANFVQELAQDERLARIPVIMISDWPSPFMWQKAASAGVFYVVNKSEFDARYVHATLKQARERSEKVN
ncbi:MAG: response regulator [Sulfitobacter sp.]